MAVDEAKLLAVVALVNGDRHRVDHGYHEVCFWVQEGTARELRIWEGSLPSGSELRWFVNPKAVACVYPVEP